MKKKYIISAIVAAILFAFVYIFFNLNLILSLGIGIALYYATYLIIPNKKINIIETKSIEEIIEYTYLQIDELKNVLKEIEDTKIKKNFTSVCSDITKIIKEIKSKPQKTTQIQNFISYYLPVSIKVLKQYDEIENQRITSVDSTEFKNKVINMSEKIKQATKNQLNSMYNTEIINTNAEIKVFETMLKSDGLLDEITSINEDEKEGNDGREN